MHISAELIESFPTTYSSWRCAKEHFSIPLEAHHKRSVEQNFCFRPKKFESCNFLISWPILLKLQISASEIKSFRTPCSLSNSSEEKLQFTPFWGGPKTGWSDGLRFGIIQSNNFFVLSPILVKFHIRTRLIESFSMAFRFLCCAKEKLHFTPVHTLHQLKCDEGVFPPLRRVVEF